MTRWTTANERFAYFEKVRQMVDGPPKRTLRDVGRDLGLSAERVRTMARDARRIKAITDDSKRGSE